MKPAFVNEEGGEHWAEASTGGKVKVKSKGVKLLAEPNKFKSFLPPCLPEEWRHHKARKYRPRKLIYHIKSVNSKINDENLLGIEAFRRCKHNRIANSSFSPKNLGLVSQHRPRVFSSSLNHACITYICI